MNIDIKSVKFIAVSSDNLKLQLRNRHITYILMAFMLFDITISIL